MSPLDLFKLEKLRIAAFKNEDRTIPASPASMDAMFNPTSFERKHAVTYAQARRRTINSALSPATYSYTAPDALSFKLVFDGTGVAFMGASAALRAFGGRTVKRDIATFEALCLRMNGEIHQPNFLIVSWGHHLSFWGRLEALTVKYTLFDQGGDPLRAELDVSFTEDIPAEKGAMLSAKSSPDLTHVRVVKSGDTLPLLCKEIYGSSAHYLFVAAANGLDDFRGLVPGQRLTFPPLPDGA